MCDDGNASSSPAPKPLLHQHWLTKRMILSRYPATEDIETLVKIHGITHWINVATDDDARTENVSNQAIVRGLQQKSEFYSFPTPLDTVSSDSVMLKRVKCITDILIKNAQNKILIHGANTVSICTKSTALATVWLSRDYKITATKAISLFFKRITRPVFTVAQDEQISRLCVLPARDPKPSHVVNKKAVLIQGNLHSCHRSLISVVQEQNRHVVMMITSLQMC